MIKAAFCVLLLMFATSAFAWSRYDAYTTPTNREHQQRIEELQRRLEQTEFERQLAENEARREAYEAQREAEERAREAEEQAQEAATNIRNEMIRSAVRAKNNVYLIGLLVLIGGFVTYIVKKFNREKSMDENQKYGVIIMILSSLLILLVLMISEGWDWRLDYFENLMITLRIELIKVKNDYLIDWPSRYVVLVLLTVAAYGLTTYLGITPAIRPGKKYLAK